MYFLMLLLYNKFHIHQLFSQPTYQDTYGKDMRGIITCVLCGDDGLLWWRILGPSMLVVSELVCWRSHSPWFEYPESDRTLLSKSKSTQYFPKESIVESEVRSGLKPCTRWLLNRSKQWKCEGLFIAKKEKKIVTEISLLRIQEVPIASNQKKSSFLSFFLQPSIPGSSLRTRTDRRFKQAIEKRKKERAKLH